MILNTTKSNYAVYCRTLPVFNSSVSTGYFDNFYLRPIEMKNASGYIDELNLTSANPTTRLGAYTLRLEGIDPKELDVGENFSITLYFKPQSYFYLGLIISGLTFTGCVGYLLWDWRKRRRQR